MTFCKPSAKVENEISAPSKEETTSEIPDRGDATETRGVPFNFVVEYQDANGNTDADISGDVVTLTESSASVSFVQPASASVVAVVGVASFTGVGSTQAILDNVTGLNGLYLIATDDAGGTFDLSATPVNSSTLVLD